jgi:hypothetical protein
MTPREFCNSLIMLEHVRWSGAGPLRMSWDARPAEVRSRRVATQVRERPCNRIKHVFLIVERLANVSPSSSTTSERTPT